MTTPEELDALQQRLLSRDKSRHGYSGHPLYNRDGPEASGAITALRARVAELDAATDQLQYIASANATRAEKAEAGGPLIEYIRADLATPAPVVPAEGLDPERLVMAWMSEMEGFATRGERFMDTITDGNDVAPWLHAACQVGIDAALRSAPPVGARVAGWQPIETAPKDGVTEVLMYDPDLGMAVWPSSSSPWPNVTHWMPLPEPPAALLPAGEGE